MRTLVKWLAIGALAALVAVAFEPVARADDDFAVFTLSNRTRIAQVTLEPGIYAFRATHGLGGTEMFVRVADVSEMNVYVTVDARMQSVLSVPSEHRLVLDAGDPGRLLSWEVENKAYSLTFPK